ncbi:MAG: hypothetical protein ACUVQP_08830 [Bacteroidales bacterium]
MEKDKKIIEIDESSPEGIKEKITIRIYKGNKAKGERQAIFSFNSDINDNYIYVFVKRHGHNVYRVREVINGVYEVVDNNSEWGTSEAIFLVRNDEEIEKIIREIIDERKKYLANLWQEKIEYKITL